MMLEFECINGKKLENYEKIYPASFKLLSRFSSWWILGKSLLWNGISVVVRQRCELDKYKFTQILANWVPNKNHKFLEASGSMTAVWQDLGNCSLLLCRFISLCLFDITHSPWKGVLHALSHTTPFSLLSFHYSTESSSLLSEESNKTVQCVALQAMQTWSGRVFFNMWSEGVSEFLFTDHPDLLIADGSANLYSCLAVPLAETTMSDSPQTPIVSKPIQGECQAGMPV